MMPILHLGSAANIKGSNQHLLTKLSEGQSVGEDQSQGVGGGEGEGEASAWQ